MNTRFARAIATMATAAFLTVSTAAAAAPAPARNAAAPLSLTKSLGARAGAKTSGKSRLGADIAGSTLINIGILAALTAGVLVFVADGDDNDSPDSP